MSQLPIGALAPDFELRTSEGQVRRLYAAGGDNEPVADPKAYIGKPLSGLCPFCGHTTEFVDFQENLRESGRSASWCPASGC